MDPVSGEMDADAMLTLRSAYLAMVEFTLQYSLRAPTSTVGLLYGDIAPDSPMDPSHDPAMWADWLDAIRVTLTGPQSNAQSLPDEWRAWNTVTTAEELLVRGLTEPITDVMVEQVTYRRAGFGQYGLARELAIGTCSELLFQGYVSAGDVDDPDWELDPPDAVERIARHWLSSERHTRGPVGSIVILVPTEAGHSVAHATRLRMRSIS